MKNLNHKQIAIFAVIIATLIGIVALNGQLKGKNLTGSVSNISYQMSPTASLDTTATTVSRPVLEYHNIGSDPIPLEPPPPAYEPPNQQFILADPPAPVDPTPVDEPSITAPIPSPSPTPVASASPITRGELAKLLVQASKVAINKTGGPHFSDVTSTNPYYKFIETAYKGGWFMGYPDGTFKPLSTVNRAEAAKLLNESLLSSKTCPAAVKGKYYQDVPAGKKAPWFYQYVKKLADCLVVDTLPSGTSMYLPADLLTKAQASLMIKNYRTSPY